MKKIDGNLTPQCEDVFEVFDTEYVIRSVVCGNINCCLYHEPVIYAANIKTGKQAGQAFHVDDPDNITDTAMGGILAEIYSQMEIDMALTTPDSGAETVPDCTP